MLHDLPKQRTQHSPLMVGSFYGSLTYLALTTYLIKKLLYFNYNTAFSRTEKICINWRIVVKVLRKNNIYYSAKKLTLTLHCTVIETKPISAERRQVYV